MNRLFFFIFFFIVLLVEGVEAAVDVRSTRFTTTSGLGNNSVRYMYQDSKGFIWMGTLNGLSRFDGTSFVTFRPRKGNKPSLPAHRIQEGPELFFMDKDNWRVSRVLRLEEGLLCGFYR